MRPRLVCCQYPPCSTRVSYFEFRFSSSNCATVTRKTDAQRDPRPSALPKNTYTDRKPSEQGITIQCTSVTRSQRSFSFQIASCFAYKANIPIQTPDDWLQPHSPQDAILSSKTSSKERIRLVSKRDTIGVASSRRRGYGWRIETSKRRFHRATRSIFQLFTLDCFYLHRRLIDNNWSDDHSSHTARSNTSI